MDEIRELCLNCRYADCFGRDGCPERLKIIARLKKQEASGRMIRIGNEMRGITEWLRIYHISWKTVNRYTQEHMCSRVEAVRELCEKKMQCTRGLQTGHRMW